MAVIVPGSIVGDIRGSVGSETYSRNQGGLYVRARAGPTTPPTALQINVTDTMTVLSQAWSGTLTDDERESWRLYADEHPRANAWGKRSYSNGYTRFIRINFLFYQLYGSLRTTTAPTGPPIGAPISLVRSFASTNVMRFYDALLPDIPADANYLWYGSCGLQQNAGVTFYATPYSIRNWGTKSKPAWSTGYVHLYSTEDLQAGNVIWGKMIVQAVASNALSSPACTRVVIE